MLKPRLARIAASLLAATLVASAALALPGLLAPQVRLESIGTARVEGSAARARVRLAVKNPNPFDLGVSALQYRLQMEGANAGTGALARPVLLAASAETGVDVEVQFDLRVLGVAFDRALRSGSLPYQLDGSITLSGGPTFPFHRADAIALPALTGRP